MNKISSSLTTKSRKKANRLYIFNVTILEIVDSDTVKTDIDLGFGINFTERMIKLYGLDSPSANTADVMEKKFGLLCKEALEKYLPIKSQQQLVSVDTTSDKYGRILGEFLVDSLEFPNHKINLNRYLIDKRLAVPYHGEDIDTIKELHHQNRMFLMKYGLVS